MIVLLHEMGISESVQSEGIGIFAAVGGMAQVLCIVLGCLAVVALAEHGLTAPEEGIGIDVLIVVAYLE